MRLDYSDKVGALRESERKPVQKNRPRKAPVGVFAVLGGLVLLGLTYGGGVLTGWYLFKGEPAPAASAAPPPAVTQQEPLPPAVPAAGAPQDTQYTFYKTLPSGGQGALGSGMNLKLQEPAPVPKAAAPAAPAAPEAAAAASPAAAPAAEKAPDKGAEPPAAEKQAAKTAAGTKYLVQIASYRDKKEAEGVQAKLNGRGVAAYLVETKVQDKVWYRLRAGRHLSKEEASQLAAKVGSGAAVVAE